ncbi:unnamed protein product [Agarophyton chilense]
MLRALIRVRIARLHTTAPEAHRAGATRSFFDVLGVSESFDVDAGQLAAQFKQLQRRWHPDRFHNSPKEEQQFAKHMSATLNVAYTTLRQPHERARHLLHLRSAHAPRGQQSEQPEQHLEAVLLEPHFLTWVMHFREQIAEAAGDSSRLEQLSQQLANRMEHCLQLLQTAFHTNRLTQAAQHTAELQYYHRMEKAIHDIS